MGNHGLIYITCPKSVPLVKKPELKPRAIHLQTPRF